MDERVGPLLWRQFGAAIDMLAQPLRACPDALWRERVWNVPYAEFWNVAYHALFWLDLYLTGTAEGFAPPPPFTLDELDPEGHLPERPFTRDELLSYLGYARNRCCALLEGLTDEQASRRFSFRWGEMSYLELQLYSLRHVQEHAAQLSLLLGQKLGATPDGVDWVPYAVDR